MRGQYTAVLLFRWFSFVARFRMQKPGKSSIWPWVNHILSPVPSSLLLLLLRFPSGSVPSRNEPRGTFTRKNETVISYRFQLISASVLGHGLQLCKPRARARALRFLKTFYEAHVRCAIFNSVLHSSPVPRKWRSFRRQAFHRKYYKSRGKKEENKYLTFLVHAVSILSPKDR